MYTICKVITKMCKYIMGNSVNLLFVTKCNVCVLIENKMRHESRIVGDAKHFPIKHVSF